MGLYNALTSEWICPCCGTPQCNEFQFKYGPCMGYSYKLGEKIDWNRSGKLYGERLPEGSGVIEAIGGCSNSWRNQWSKKNGLGTMDGFIAAFESPGGARPPNFTLAEKKELGCPDWINIRIELTNDKLVRMIIPSAEELWQAEGR